METTFIDVAITIKAKSAKAAYTKLCNLLAKGDPNIGWNTERYITGNQLWDEARSTEELFPRIPKKLTRVTRGLRAQANSINLTI